MTTKRITNSELSTFKDCKRKWWLGNYRHLGLKRRAKTGAAPLGSDIHACLENLYVHGVDPLLTLAAIREETLASLPGDEIFDLTAYEKQCALAEKMLEGFMEWQAEVGLDCGYETVSVEEKVSVPVDFPCANSWESVELMGKLDLQVRREADGAILNRDWKTVQNLEEGKLVQNEQFVYYALIKKLMGDTVNGAQRVMLRKVKRTGNAKSPFYGIDEALYTDKRLRIFYNQVWGTVAEIAEAVNKLDAGADPITVCAPRPNRDCHWKCEFYTVCPMFDDGSNAEGMLSAYYETHDPLARYDNPDANDGEAT